MISIRLVSVVVIPNGVDLLKCNPLPHIVVVIPVPEIESIAFFIPARILSADTFSSLLEAVGSGLTKAILALAVIAT